MAQVKIKTSYGFYFKKRKPEHKLDLREIPVFLELETKTQARKVCRDYQAKNPAHYVRFAKMGGLTL